jgi:hypothetical protein
VLLSGRGPPKKEARVYRGSTRPLGTSNLGLLSERFDLSAGELDRFGVLEDQSDRRVVVPIIGPYGEHRGVYLRKFAPSRWDDVYREASAEGQPLIGWYGGGHGVRESVSDLPGGPHVLVEDCFSAIKVARQFTAVCLFGTHIKLEAMLEVVKETDNIVLCLDRDAYDKAVGLKMRFNYIAPSMRVVRLEKDLKYESDERIREIVT